MGKLATIKGREFWIQRDETAGVWEMFASNTGGDYLGCFDTKAEALTYAKTYHDDNL